MWQGKQRRRSSGHVAVSCTQCAAIWAVGFSDAAVSVHALVTDLEADGRMRSGQSIFSQPKPIDINTARRAGFGLDGDLDSDEEDAEQQPLVRESVVFDAETLAGDEEQGNMPRTAPALRDQTDIWAEIG